tara:strand:- start:266 stop:583 length:318 start_codon:yes stop_codon:yes gene_type:complete
MNVFYTLSFPPQPIPILLCQSKKLFEVNTSREGDLSFYHFGIILLIESLLLSLIAQGQHFMQLEGRLKDLGYEYGSFPSHGALWDAALKSGTSLHERLGTDFSFS